MGTNLADLLRAYAREGRAPFHMPGHKRSARYDYLNNLGASMDITEIDGFDNLHDASGILLDGMKALSAVYGSTRSFYLVNGSTGGLLAAVRCAVPYGGEVIAARNCHKSVYAALELVNARVHYLYPPREETFGFCLAVPPQSVMQALADHPAAKAVILTSPTYDGVVSDIAAIAGICRAHAVPLIIDEAHGAHLGFLDEGVKSAVSLGADLVIQSFHKTLPSLTQTAAAHVCGTRVPPERYAAELSVFETSSPSYLLMASLDGCVRLLADEARRAAFFSRWREALDDLEARLRDLDRIRVFMRPPILSEHIPAYDRSKFAITADGMDGRALAAILRAHGVEPELVSANYVLLMSGADISRSDIDALMGALKSAQAQRGSAKRAPALPDIRPEIVLTSAAARQRETEILPLDRAAGAVSADYVFAYPPGIPIVIPGERLTRDICSALKQLTESELNPATFAGAFRGEIAVLR